MTETLLDKNIILLDISAKDNIDAIKQLGQILVNNKYIDASYTDSVIEREASFPTGLALTNAGIAIPHASPNNNIQKNGIAAARLKNPIKFYSMENPDEKISINMIFMLALSSSTEHLDVLKKLFIAFQNQELVSQLKVCQNKEIFLKLLADNLN